MRRHRSYAIAALTALAAFALLASGCGDDNETTTTTSALESEQQSIDAAIKSCKDQAQQLGGAAGTALASACTSVGNTAKQILNTGGEDVEQALSDAAGSCKNEVGQLPSGQAQDALSQLCDAMATAATPGSTE